jgi:tRNA A37 threonylcarbamoyltransferase TsaD
MIVLGLETSCDETGLALYDSELGLRGQVFIVKSNCMRNMVVWFQNLPHVIMYVNDSID